MKKPKHIYDHNVYLIYDQISKRYQYSGYLKRKGYHEFHDFEETKYYIK